MSATFQCPNCQEEIAVPPDHTMNQIACGGCWQLVDIPDRSESLAKSSESPTKEKQSWQNESSTTDDIFDAVYTCPKCGGELVAPPNYMAPSVACPGCRHFVFRSQLRTKELGKTSEVAEQMSESHADTSNGISYRTFPSQIQRIKDIFPKHSSGTILNQFLLEVRTRDEQTAKVIRGFYETSPWGMWSTESVMSDNIVNLLRGPWQKAGWFRTRLVPRMPSASSGWVAAFAEEPYRDKYGGDFAVCAFLEAMRAGNELRWPVDENPDVDIRKINTQSKLVCASASAFFRTRPSALLGFPTCLQVVVRPGAQTTSVELTYQTWRTSPGPLDELVAWVRKRDYNSAASFLNWAVQCGGFRPEVEGLAIHLRDYYQLEGIPLVHGRGEDQG